MPRVVTAPGQGNQHLLPLLREAAAGFPGLCPSLRGSCPLSVISTVVGTTTHEVLGVLLVNHQTQGTLGNPKMKVKTCHRPNESFSKSEEWHQHPDASSDASAGLTSYQTHSVESLGRKDISVHEAGLCTCEILGQRRRQERGSEEAAQAPSTPSLGAKAHARRGRGVPI